MITDVRVIPIRYASGTRLTSGQRKVINLDNVSEHINTGSTIIAPEQWCKILAYERFGRIDVTHTFLQIGDRRAKLVPICVKINDGNDANVLLCRTGIEHALNLLGDTSLNVEFIQHRLWRIIRNVMYLYDPQMYYDHVDMDDTTEDAMHDLLMDNTCYRSDITSDQSVSHPCRLRGGLHPLIRDLSSIARIFTDVSVRLRDDRRSGTLTALDYDEYFKPFLPWNYRAIAYDKLTTRVASEEELSIADLLQGNGVYAPSHHLIRKVSTRSRYIEITEFASALLELCVILHNQTLDEFSFRYILPTRSSAGEFQFESPSGTISFGMRCDLIAASCDYIAQCHPHATEIRLSKLTSDEVFMMLRFPDEKKYYHLDLGITSLMSQGIVTIADLV